MWNILYSLFHVDKNDDDQNFIRQWCLYLSEKQVFSEGNCCTKLLLKKTKKCILTRIFIWFNDEGASKAGHDHDDVENDVDSDDQLSKYSNICSGPCVVDTNKKETAFRIFLKLFFWQCKKSHSLLWRVRDRLKKCLFWKKKETKAFPHNWIVSSLIFSAEKTQQFLPCCWVRAAYNACIKTFYARARNCPLMCVCVFFIVWKKNLFVKYYSWHRMAWHIIERNCVVVVRLLLTHSLTWL